MAGFYRTNFLLGRVGLLVFILLFSTLATFAQPMSSGIELSGERFFLEEGKLKSIDSQGVLKSENRTISSLDSEPPSAQSRLSDHDFKFIHQPQGWTNSFLLGNDTLIVEIDTSGQASRLLDSKEGKAQVWGSSLLWQQKETKALKVIEKGKEIFSLNASMIFSGPHILDDSTFFVINSDQSYSLFQRDQLQEPKTVKLPFEVEGSSVSLNSGNGMIWHKGSNQVVLVHPLKRISLQHSASSGVKALPGGKFLIASPSSLDVIDENGNIRTLANAPGFTEETFKNTHVSEHNSNLSFVLQTSDQGISIQTIPHTGDNTSSVLKEQTVKGFASQDSDGGAQVQFLVTEKSFEEDRVDNSGQRVVNPKTQEPDKITVKTDTLFLLDDLGRWQEVFQEKRTKLVGPLQIVGDQLVVGSQLEPSNVVGQKRSVHRKFSTPPVILRGFDSKTGQQSWTLELPRGDSPSSGRLPDQTWPTLKENGPILFTTEDNRLSALDPSTGRVSWTSSTLPLDDSKPPMLRWGNSLGLVATNRTSKNLLLFSDDGQLTSSTRLNTFFNEARWLNFLGVVVICLALIVYIYLAGKKKLFIRRIAGLEALDEAVGRATEMGKPVLYVTGLADVDDIQTLAALSILSHVAKKTAEYDASILATTSRAVTFSAAQEVVRDAFTIAGRPDSFHLESVQYISDDQFGYAAGVDGMMVREEPAANFYMGKFYAESLIFAETGHATGAIQIAGTAQPNQLPFFVAACDYTLIGEELFAASAYLSGDPMQVGSLRGQDVGKAIVMVVLVLLSLYATFVGEVF